MYAKKFFNLLKTILFALSAYPTLKKKISNYANVLINYVLMQNYRNMYTCQKFICTLCKKKM